MDKFKIDYSYRVDPLDIENKTHYQVAFKIDEVYLVDDTNSIKLRTSTNVPPSIGAGLPPYETNVCDVIRQMFVFKKGKYNNTVKHAKLTRVVAVEDLYIHSETDAYGNPLSNVSNTYSLTGITVPEMLKEGYIANCYLSDSIDSDITPYKVTEYDYFLSPVYIHVFDSLDEAKTQVEMLKTNIEALVRRLDKYLELYPEASSITNEFVEESYGD